MINAYDIETYVDINNSHHIPYCVCFNLKNLDYYLYKIDNIDIVFNSISKIFQNICSKEKCLFYVHNLDFDGSLIISSLSYHKHYKFDVFIKESRIYSIKINYNLKRIEFKCSQKILPSSLRNIALSFNIEEKKFFPYSFACEKNLYYIGPTPSSEFFNSYTEWEKVSSEYSVFDFRNYTIWYCTHDVRITKKFMEVILDMLKEFNININEIYSSPSLALKLFTNNFNHHNVKTSYNYLLDTLVRPAYFGGRCEIYGNPTDNEYIYHYDFSGMYAQCMLEKYAYGKWEIVENDFDLNQPGFYCVEVESANLNIPILPHHRLKNNKLMFSNGVFSNIYWFEEILLFIKYGGVIKKISYGIVFNNYSKVFNKYVDYFTKIREKGNEYKTFGKLMINSLYGRFGMDSSEYHWFFIENEKFDYYNKSFNIISRKIINNLSFVKVKLSTKLIKHLKIKKRKEKSNVTIAAAITSKARIKLFKAQMDVINNKGRLLYSDTDSIYAAFQEKVDNMHHGEIFWDMSKNDTNPTDAVFIAPKTYAVKYKNNNIVKIKGIVQNSISFDLIKNLFYTNEESIVFKNIKNIKKTGFKIEESIIDKEISINKYDKRKFVDNKKNTIPFYYKNYIYI